MLIAACVMTGCISEQFDSNADIAIESTSTKIVNTPVDAVEGELLVCFNAETSANIREGKAAEFMSSNTVDLKSIEPIFRVTENNAKYMRKYQLDRWYKVKFEGTGLSQAASELAQFGEISRVQYNKHVQHGSDTKATTWTAGENAGTNELPFNDPMLKDQWHYINTGDKTVSTAAVAGADIAIKDVWGKLNVKGSSDIIVAIIDGPVKYDHVDLEGNMWVNKAEKNGNPGVDDDNNGYADDVYGWNCDHDTCEITYKVKGESGHGTHVAGIVGAVNGNNEGVCGVAGGTGNGDGVRLISCQVFYQSVPSGQKEPAGWPSGSEACTARAFQYATAAGAAIAQCSYGFSTKMTSDKAYAKNSAEKEAIDYFMKYGGGDALKGGLPIFAAGNEASNYSSYPGAYRDFISVTAMSCDYTPAYYTNFGPGSNIAAPGGDYLQKYYTDRTGLMNSEVYSTTFVEGQYGYKQGTSMACPHVSGVAALAVSHALKLGKKLTNVELRNILLGSTHDIDRYCVGSKTGVNGNGNALTVQLSNFKAKMGVGYIDAFKTLMNVQGTPTLTVRTGVKEGKDLADVIGGNPTAMKDKEGNTTITVTISDRDRERIGLEGDITISSTGKLGIKCTKIGSAVIKVSYIVGGAELGSDEATGGMSVTREVAILSRAFATNGAWL